jgi:serine/threonine protein kinase
MLTQLVNASVCQSTLPSIKISEVKLGDIIGEGSEGIVRKGYWPAKGKFVAVKSLMNPQDDINEIKILEQTQHSNIIKIYGIDKTKS